MFAPMAMRRAGYQIKNSLRFRASNSARLTRTGLTSVTANRHVVSFWAKLGAGANQALFCGYSNGNNYTYFGTSVSNQLSFLVANGGVTQVQFTTNAVYRDPTALYHVAVIVDTTLSTASDRYQIWVNGSRVTSFATSTNTAAQNIGMYWGDNFTQYIGTFDTATNYFDGYLADFVFTGQMASNPSVGAFGQTDPATGVWVPKKYAGTYGANGFYLPFNDATSTTTLAQDRSGNGNNWTTSGISVTAGVTFDQMTDTPTNSYATINPLHRMLAVGPVTSWGNTRYQSGNGSYYPRGAATQPFVDDATGWYCEFTLTTAHLGVEGFGVVAANAYINDSQGIGGGPLEWGYQGNGVSGRITTNNVNAFSGLSLWSAGQVGQIAYRNGSLWLGINNTWFNSGNPSAGTGAVYTGLTGPLFPLCLAGSTTPVIDANFGQRPFAYTPPTGFKSLCTQNMPSQAVTLSGSFTGNANADGPPVWINGNPATLTINGNPVTFGTHADKTAGGFKLRSSSNSYNQAGTNTWTATAGNRFRGTNRVPNNAQVNP